MKENEAIVQLNFDMEMIRFNPDTGETLTLEEIKARNEDNYKTYLADELAITALTEIQQYRAIGTVEEIYSMLKVLNRTVSEIHSEVNKYQSIGTIEEFKALKEKAEPKKPILNNPKINEFYIKEAKLCPACHSYINNYSGDYCRDCGQKLDWSK